MEFCRPWSVKRINFKDYGEFVELASIPKDKYVMVTAHAGYISSAFRVTAFQ